MNPEIEKIIDKAKRSLETAKRLYQDGDYDFVASRAYYSMFYMAEAILLTKEFSFSKHSAVISAFGKNFIKTGIFPNKYHQMLIDAFRTRNIGDYGYEEDVTGDEADIILKNAEQFLGKVEEYIEGNIRKHL